MQDRFKYRVWDKQDECYAYSNNSDVDMLYIETDGELTYGVWNEDYEDMFYTPESEVIVEQCTGLKDKNDKLIYEGDILNSLYRNDGCNGLYVVVWRNGSLNVDKFGKHQQNFVNISLNDLKRCEIIGNIHENADLLENKDE